MAYFAISMPELLGVSAASESMGRMDGILRTFSTGLVSIDLLLAFQILFYASLVLGAYALRRRIIENSGRTSRPAAMAVPGEASGSDLTFFRRRFVTVAMSMACARPSVEEGEQVLKALAEEIAKAREVHRGMRVSSAANG